MKQPGLLTYMSSRFARSQEDWATYALTFLLGGCPEASDALRKYLLRSLQMEVDAGLSYRGQETDAKSGRPDVVGTDPTGNRQLIIEAKFWARLTDKQPGAYMEMLTVGKPGVVLVIAPAARLITLWPELLANLAAYRREPVPAADHQAGRYELVLPSGHLLALRSWRDVLEELDGRLRVAELFEWQADLAQLRGLTERMDQIGFLPLLTEDLDTRTARQISSLFPLVKRLVGEFGSNDRLEKLSDKHSYDPLYYGWWLRSKECGIKVWVGLYLKAWAEHGCSPLWADVYPDPQSGWTMPELDRALSCGQLPAGAMRWEDENEPRGAVLIPLMLTRSAVEDDVIADLKAQLSAIAETVDRAAAEVRHDTARAANDLRQGSSGS
jgi:hypothetical protein